MSERRNYARLAPAVQVLSQVSTRYYGYPVQHLTVVQLCVDFRASRRCLVLQGFEFGLRVLGLKGAEEDPGLLFDPLSNGLIIESKCRLDPASISALRRAICASSHSYLDHFRFTDIFTSSNGLTLSWVSGPRIRLVRNLIKSGLDLARYFRPHYRPKRREIRDRREELAPNAARSEVGEANVDVAGGLAGGWRAAGGALFGLLPTFANHTPTGTAPQWTFGTYAAARFSVDHLLFRART
ncbi:hypothetical protein C8R44DRAFT_745251 [Mycena epipterygia]|nr:hypothetical protein C8R44DRAFT_749058 [Mycena epipterygia]KAJ7106163.1 hypothetical protein C8R44DRAFT_745251 [Mycena epipterygia]